MPSVLLVDPLWWVAARLRRILTGLLMLGLALGAAAEVRGAAVTPATEAPSFVVTSFAAPMPSADPAIAASAGSGVASAMALSDAPPEPGVRRHVGPLPAAGVDAAGPERGSAAEWFPAEQIHRLLLTPDLIAARPAPGPDERPERARRAAPLGQRAPPAP